MKKLLAVLLTCSMVFGLTACGLGGGAGQWTDADLSFSTDSDKIEVENGKAFIVYKDSSYLTEHSDGSYEEYQDEYVTSRGLKLGMSLDEVKKLYKILNGYAVWEVYTGESNEYTNFVAYKNQDPEDMYDGTNNNVWIDLGFCKENGKWRELKDVEVQDIWFCDADFNDYEEVVVFGINFDDMGYVNGISLEHFDYDQAWSDYQGWAE